LGGAAARPAEAAADSAADSEGTAPPAPPDPDAEAEAEAEWVSAWAQAGDREGWLDENPLGVPTERECQTVDSGGRCYRVMLVRNDVAA
jgi:hypothetical protein